MLTANRYKFIMGMHLQMLTTASHRGLRDRNGRLYFAVCWTKTKSKLESCGFAVREVCCVVFSKPFDESSEESSQDTHTYVLDTIIQRLPESGKY